LKGDGSGGETLGWDGGKERKGKLGGERKGKGKQRTRPKRRTARRRAVVPLLLCRHGVLVWMFFSLRRFVSFRVAVSIAALVFVEDGSGAVERGGGVL
jgi:hypothetical protein